VPVALRLYLSEAILERPAPAPTHALIDYPYLQHRRLERRKGKKNHRPTTAAERYKRPSSSSSRHGIVDDARYIASAPELILPNTTRTTLADQMRVVRSSVVRNGRRGRGAAGRAREGRVGLPGVLRVLSFPPLRCGEPSPISGPDAAEMARANAEDRTANPVLQPQSLRPPGDEASAQGVAIREHTLTNAGRVGFTYEH
jgi:hypothetical protein